LVAATAGIGEALADDASGPVLRPTTTTVNITGRHLVA
jgi:hypothetical protein